MLGGEVWCLLFRLWRPVHAKLLDGVAGAGADGLSVEIQAPHDGEALDLSDNALGDVHRARGA